MSKFRYFFNNLFPAVFNLPMVFVICRKVESIFKGFLSLSALAIQAV